MFKNKVLTKGLIIGIITLFLAISVVPGITSIKGTYNVGVFENKNLQKEKILDQFKSNSMFFTENKGQFPEEVLFQTHGIGATVYFCKNKIVTVFIKKFDKAFDEDTIDIQEKRTLHTGEGVKSSQSEMISVVAEFICTNPEINVYGKQRLPHYNNYFIGNDPSKWYTNIPNYENIIYQDVYPGIDISYYIIDNKLKYDFIIQPGADISQIQIRYNGINGLTIDPNGDLLIQTEYGVIHENIPLMYQKINDRNLELTGGYCLPGTNVFGFEINGYNPQLPLVIDPELEYSTFIGGTGREEEYGFAVDNEGCAYISGYTKSSDFPTTPGAYDTTYNSNEDVFVTKLNPTGTSLIYSTYVGGTGEEEGRSVVVDTNGNSYITGYTDSSDFPTTPGAYDTTYNGGDGDTFITKLNPSGTSLTYSTYIGGTGDDEGSDVVVDTNGNSYITGYTDSSDFPTTPGAYDTTYNDNGDGFVTKLNPTGTSLIYSTYIGGTYDDIGISIALDTNGNSYITGYTDSSDFPTTPGAFDTTYNGGVYDGFVTKLNPTGTSLTYSTYIGGTGVDEGSSIVVDTNGNSYITGVTGSSNFPTTSGAYDTSFNGGQVDVFVTKLNPTGTSLTYSTYIGGTNVEVGYNIALYTQGFLYIIGYTGSSDFPTTPGAYDTTYNGYEDVFVTILNPTGTSLTYSTYIGGTDGDIGTGVVVDNDGYTYITGETFSSDFPTTPDAYDTTYNGASDVFMTKIILVIENQPPNAPSNPDPSDGATGVDVNADLSWTCSDPDGDPLTYDVYFEADDSTPDVIVSSNQSGTTYDPPGNLEFNTQYYWQIIAWDDYGASNNSLIWSFTTLENNPPNTPSNPSPPDGETDVDVNADLSWTCSDPDGDDLVYDVYFGTSSNPPLVSNHQSQTFYNPPGAMQYNTHYYWKIVAWDPYDESTTGPIWDFTTSSEPNNPPYIPSDPIPENGSTDIELDVVLSWSGGDPDQGDTVVYDVYLEANNPNPTIKVSNDQTGTTFNPDSLQPDTIYYWKIIAKDNHNIVTQGPIWHFTTKEAQNHPPGTPTINGPDSGKPGTPYDFILNAMDIDGDQVKYIIDWGDGKTDTTNLYPSSSDVTVSHTWSTKGTYTIKAKAEDSFGLAGPEATKVINIQKSKEFNMPITKLLQIYPNLFSILKLIQRLGLQ